MSRRPDWHAARAAEQQRKAAAAELPKIAGRPLGAGGGWARLMRTIDREERAGTQSKGRR